MSLIEELRTEIEILKLERDELNTMSSEYEKQMEDVIEKLKLELNDQKKKITTLEIRSDDLENEILVKTSRIKALQLENDTLMERNVLLEHDLLSLKDIISKIKEDEED